MEVGKSDEMIRKLIQTCSVALAFALSLGLVGCDQQSAAPTPTKKQRPPPVVTTGKVVEKFVVDEIEAIGTLRANESVVISAAVTEPVASVNFKDGQRVNQGDLLVALTSDEQAAELAEAQANLADADRQLQRIKSIGKGLASKSDIDAAQAKVDAYQGQLGAIKARLADRLVTAPFSGVLGFRQVSVGALVTPGTEITTLDDISVVKLDFTVPEVYLGKVHFQSLVTGISPAWPAEEFNGRVSSIDSRVDPGTRAIQVRAEIDNPDHKLLPGMLINVTLFSDQYAALVVEESAIVQSGAQARVFIVQDDATVELREVTIAKRLPGQVVISAGVQRDETVVIDGTFNLRPGTKVLVLQEDQSSLAIDAGRQADHRG